MDRTHSMAERKTFILPVVIDGTAERGAAVPEKFRDVQWMRLLDGAADPTFLKRITSLVALPDTERAPVTVGIEDLPKRSRSVSRAALLLVTLLVAGGAALWFVLRHDPSLMSASTLSVTESQSVAVLPFVDMSEKHDQEYFSDGLSEELIDVLARLPGLRVPARTSSFSFKNKSVTIGEIAKILTVSHVLEGSLRKSGDRLRVTAQLVRATDGFHEWSQSYDRDVSDALAVQGEIARSVAAQLKITLAEGEKLTRKSPIRPEAYSLYLEGRFHVMADDNVVASDLFKRAVAIEPRFASAWAWLSFCLTRRIANGDTVPETYRTAEQSAARAMELDPDLPQGYTSGAIIALQYSLDWKTAQRLLDKALQLDPNDSNALAFRAHLTQAVGTIEDAEAYMRQSIDLDPLNPLTRRYLARLVLYAGRPAESVDIMRQTIRENADYPALHYELARALYAQGAMTEAAQAYETESSASWRPLGLPVAYKITHRDAQARAALDELERNSQGAEFQVAEAYAVFGELDHAFEWLERAREQHDAGLMYIKRDPMLKPVYADPRYREFLRKIRLPE